MDCEPLPSPLDRADRRFDQAARRLAAVACALLLLCGCEGKPPEEAEIAIPRSLAQRDFPPPGWAWGALRVPGAPPLRYGVAAPAVASRAQVLILPGAGEPAEAWFETASSLVGRGYTVWALDWAGQGGSRRWPGAADRLYAPSLDPDVRALRTLVAEVVRPGPGRPPLVLLGDGLGAQLALRALAQGTPGVVGAVLGAPALAPRPLRLAQPFGDWGADLAGRVGMGRPFVAGEHGWRAPERRSPGRDGVGAAWMQANPALRVGGASLAWTAAYNRSAAAARNPATLARIAPPVLMLAGPEARGTCLALQACRFVPFEGTPHLAADAPRQRWLTQAAGFIKARARDYPVGAPPRP